MPQWMLVASCVLILLFQTSSGYKVAPWRSAPSQPQPAMELKGRVQLRDQSGDDCVATLSPVFEKVLCGVRFSGLLPLIEAPFMAGWNAARGCSLCKSSHSLASFQVALLFLIIDKIPHEAVWTEWLKQLEDMMPASFLCDDKTLNCFDGLMPKTRNSVYDAQPYISLYVHPVPQFPGFPKGSIFYKREIANRVQVRFSAPLSAALRSFCVSAHCYKRGAIRIMPKKKDVTHLERAGCCRLRMGITRWQWRIV